MQVFFFLKEANEEPVEPGHEVPVEKAQIVALDVVLVVGELDALPFAFAAAFALHDAKKDLARHQLELLKTMQELRVQE